jgi:reactive intermediate/imine deaminase
MKASLLSLALFFAVTASAQEIQRINPDGMTQPTGYSHVVRHNNLLFLSGQVSVDAEGNVVGEGDMNAQLRQVLENMKIALASQGADFSNIVRVTIYTTDMDALLKTGDISREYWTDGTPANTVVQVERLARPAFLIEIESTAIAPD